MTPRSSRTDVRNPILALPSAARVAELPPAARVLLADILGELAADARTRAEYSWKRHKAPMAAYWKSVAVYARHIRQVVRVTS